MPGEVHSFVIAGLLRSLRRRGTPAEGLIDGLGLREEELRPPFGWCRWDDFARLLVQIRRLIGGPWELEQLGGEAASRDAIMRALSSPFVSPRALYLLFAGGLARRLYGCVGLQVQELQDGRILVKTRLMEGFRPSPEFFILTLGLMRSYPALLGQPYSSVEANLTSESGDYLITPPASQTVIARLEQAIGITSPEAAPAESDWDAVRGAIEIAQLELPLRRRVDVLGRELATCNERGYLFRRAASFLQREFCCDFVSLWEKPRPEGDFDLIDTHGRFSEFEGTLFTRELLVGSQVVGRVQADLTLPAEEGQLACVDAFFSWLAVGLRGCQGPPLAAALSPATPLPESVAEASALTPRQAQVVELIVRGLSNKEIAEALGCSFKTVEVHVGQVLRKSGVSSRAALTAKFWRRGSSRPPPLRSR